MSANQIRLQQHFRTSDFQNLTPAGPGTSKHHSPEPETTGRDTLMIAAEETKNWKDTFAEFMERFKEYHMNDKSRTGSKSTIV